MNAREPEGWEIYEQVAGDLLNMLSDSLGLELADVKPKDDLPGKSGTTWEIDRVGVAKDGQKVVSIECRRFTDNSKLKQSDIAALAYIKQDIGAVSEIIVTTNGVQSGGMTIAEYERIVIICLNEDATTADYLLEVVGRRIAALSASLRGKGILNPKIEVPQPDQPAR